MKPAARVMSVEEAPAPLRARLHAAWSALPAGQHDQHAGLRWRVAADAWRDLARAGGMTGPEVWAALPAGNWRWLRVDPPRDAWILERAGFDAADVPWLAAEARRFYPELFDASWPPAPWR